MEATYTLVDADGVLIEVTGPEALRANFEQLLFDKHLSADQITGVWELNEPARQTIERLFGLAVLDEAQEHLRSIQGMSKPPRDDHRPDEVKPLPLDAAARVGPNQDQCSEPGRALMLEINPTWGAQKIFQHYRAALNALSDNPALSRSAIARFREANTPVEQRLRAKLPARMREIDATYQAGLEP